MEDLLGDAEFWLEMDALVTETMFPLFLDMFEAGTLMGASRKPVAAKEVEDVDQLTELVAAEVGAAEIAFDVEFINTRASQFVENYTNQWWQGLKTKQQTKLRDAIRNARTQGTGVEGVMKSLSKEFGAVRAARIAQSEMTNLLGAGQQAVYASAGFTLWEWQTVMDAVVDPICEDLNGKQFTMDRLFEKAHVNCRCFPRPAGEVSDIPQTLGSPTPLGTFAAA